MNVCLISTFPPQKCGIGTYTANLKTALEAEGIVITVLAEQEPGFAKMPISQVFPVWTRVNFKYALLQAILNAKQKPDVVHFQHEFGLFPNSPDFKELIKKLEASGIPCVTTLHTVFATTGRAPPTNESTIIVHTEQAKLRVLCETDTCAQVIVIPHGIKRVITPLPSRTPDPRGTVNHFLTQGFISPGKGYEEILEGFQLATRLRRSNYKYTIRGHAHNIDYLNELDQIILNSGLESVVAIDQGFRNQLEEELYQDDVIILGNAKGDTFSASGQLAFALGRGLKVICKQAPIYENIEGVLYYRDAQDLRDILNGLEYERWETGSLTPPVFQGLETREWSTVARSHKELYNKLIEKKK